MPVTALDVHDPLARARRPALRRRRRLREARRHPALRRRPRPSASTRRSAISSRRRATREGRVEFAADFYLLRPVEAARGNGSLLLDVPNRGRKVALGMFNSAARVPDPTTAEDFGNGFLMRHG